MKKIALIFTTLILIVSCNQNSKDNKEISFDDSENIAKQVETEPKINDDFGPPFSDTCLSSFDYIGKLRVSESRFDLFLSGKGWNPEFSSCTYIWGELINNEFPPDTAIKDFRIHLIEVDTLSKNLDSSFFENEIFKSKLIATYSKDQNEEYRTCKFDPNNTGKYPKPKQWVE